jgi:hypothetical protein
LVYGFSFFKYLEQKEKNIIVLVFGVTLGGLFYEVVGQKMLDFGTYSNSDVVYTIFGGIASFYSLSYFTNKKR